MKINKTVKNKNKKVLDQSTAMKPVNKPLPKVGKKVSVQVETAKMKAAAGKRENSVATKPKSERVCFGLNQSKDMTINGSTSKSKTTQANGHKDQSVLEKAAAKRKMETVQWNGTKKKIRLALDAKTKGSIVTKPNSMKAVFMHGSTIKSKQLKADEDDGQSSESDSSEDSEDQTTSDSEDDTVLEKAAAKRKMETVQGNGTEERVRLSPDAKSKESIVTEPNPMKAVVMYGSTIKSKQLKADEDNGQSSESNSSDDSEDQTTSDSEDDTVLEKAAKRKMETVQWNGSEKKVRLALDAKSKESIVTKPMKAVVIYGSANKSKQLKAKEDNGQSSESNSSEDSEDQTSDSEDDTEAKLLHSAILKRLLGKPQGVTQSQYLEQTDSSTESDSVDEQPWQKVLGKGNGAVMKVKVFNGKHPKAAEKAPAKVSTKASEKVLEKSCGKTPVKVRKEPEAPKGPDAEEVREKSCGKTPVNVRKETEAPKEPDAEEVRGKSCGKTPVEVRKEPEAPKGPDAKKVLEKSVVPEIDLLDINVFENSINSNSCIAVLKQDTELYGTVIVTLLYGRITINGYKVPKNEPLTVYSPKGFNWAVITAKPSKKLPNVLSIYEQVRHIFSRVQVENIVAKYTTNDAILLLKRNRGAKKMISTFDSHMSEKVFPLINVTNRPYYSSEYMINCLVQRADMSKGMQVPIQWRSLPVKEENRFLIIGGKGVGKSTLLRYMVNRHLEVYPRVLLIDLDIGQPEIFVPQTVSCTIIDTPLLGPGMFLNMQPNIAFVVGSVNVVMCAEPYARAVRKLLACCWESPSLRSIPWLVNTMGYNKGFAKELMALIVDCVEPTDVAQIFSTKAINNFDEPLDRATLSKEPPMIYVAEEFKRGSLANYKLHHLMCAVPQDNRNYKRWTMSALDARYSNLLARLSATLQGNAKYLTECKPVQVDLNALQIVHLTSKEYSRDELIAGMEANVVYLCKRSYPDQAVECVGIGVVRCIDYKRKQLYLVPAMPFDRLTNVNCIVIGGGSSLPQGFFKNLCSCVANKVPFVFILEDSNSSKRINQIYHRAPGFLGNPDAKK